MNDDRLREVYAGVMAARGSQSARTVACPAARSDAGVWSAARARKKTASPRWTTS